MSSEIDALDGAQPQILDGFGESSDFLGKSSDIPGRKSLNLADFRDFPKFGIVFAAPTGGPEGVARCHLRGLGMRYDKN